MPGLPITRIERLERPRILIGMNNLPGFSYTSCRRMEWSHRTCTLERVATVFAHRAQQGANAIVVSLYPRLVDTLVKARADGVQVPWVSTIAGDAEPTFRDQLVEIRQIGVSTCFLRDDWVDKCPIVDGGLPRPEQFIGAFRDAGMIPGAAAHDDRRLEFITPLGYQVAAHLAQVNKLIFSMRPNCDTMIGAAASTPIIAIKPLAAGRFDERPPARGCAGPWRGLASWRRSASCRKRRPPRTWPVPGRSSARPASGPRGSRKMRFAPRVARGPG